VTVTRAVTAPPPKAIDKDPEACGTTYDVGSLRLSKDGGLANAVVTLRGALPVWKPGDEKYTIDQKACHYVPRVLVVPAGARVVFLNSDGVLHNVTWASAFNGSPNLAIPPHGQMDWVFKKAPDRVLLSCKIHSFMQDTGLVVVAENRFSAITDDDGNFTIPDVPVGTWKLEVFQELLKRTSLGDVTVEAGKTARADVRYD
jgi:plastocyanin